MSDERWVRRTIGFGLPGAHHTARCSKYSDNGQDVIVPGCTFEFAAHGVPVLFAAYDAEGQAWQQGEVFGSVALAIAL